MFDSFWSGILGGLFGPAIAQWLSRFKYWVIFLVTTLAIQLFMFAAGVKAKGLREAFEIVFMSGFDPILILVPMGGGLFAVFMAFLGSLNTPKKPSEDNKNKP
jgi:hypothetical protein